MRERERERRERTRERERDTEREREREKGEREREEHSGILHLKTQRAEHWRHAAETRLEQKQSLLVRVTQSAEAQAEALSAVGDYYGTSLTRAGSAAPSASL